MLADLAQRSPLTLRVECSLSWRASAFALCLYALSAKSSVVSSSLRPHDYSPLGSSVHGILQTRTLEWVTMPFSRGSSHPKDQICISFVSCIGRQVLSQCHRESHLQYWVVQKSSFELFPRYQNLNELFGPTQYLSSCLPLERFDFPAESSWPECVTAEKNILETNDWSKITLKSNGKSLSLGWVNAILSLYTFHDSVNVFPPLVHHPWARTVLCV